MRSALMHVGEGIGAVLSLLRLGWQTRFRVRGRYWQWRHETAFGAGEPPAPEKRKAMLDYARWVWRMGRYG